MYRGPWIPRRGIVEERRRAPGCDPGALMRLALLFLCDVLSDECFDVALFVS